MPRRINSDPFRFVRRVVAPAAVIAFAVGCGGEKDNPDSASDTPPTTSATSGSASNSASPNSVASDPMITFDYLGAGSKIILVYPGVSDSETDKKWNAQYYSGEQMPALCYAIGRTVTSDTSIGEREKSSDTFVKIVDQPGDNDDQFVPLTYTTANSAADLPGVKTC